jgi:hypothetical protein
MIQNSRHDFVSIKSVMISLATMSILGFAEIKPSPSSAVSTGTMST